ncbi:MAG: LON peptidase substrate-binding domain-containing protein, partial [Anaerolineae bacterium]|nr:LON peptidase substrate-binding domain-containing protein [Anaerolineae bacterium]
MNSIEEQMPLEADEGSETAELELLVSDMVVFPTTFRPLGISDPAKVRLIDDAVVNRRPIGVVLRRGEGDEERGLAEDDLYRVGTTIVVHRMVRQPDGSLRLMVQALERFRIVEFLSLE